MHALCVRVRSSFRFSHLHQSIQTTLDHSFYNKQNEHLIFQKNDLLNINLFRKEHIFVKHKICQGFWWYRRIPFIQIRQNITRLMQIHNNIVSSQKLSFSSKFFPFSRSSHYSAKIWSWMYHFDALTTPSTQRSRGHVSHHASRMLRTHVTMCEFCIVHWTRQKSVVNEFKLASVRLSAIHHNSKVERRSIKLLIPAWQSIRMSFLTSNCLILHTSNSVSADLMVYFQ